MSSEVRKQVSATYTDVVKRKGGCCDATDSTAERIGYSREDLEELLRLESDKSLSPVIDKVMPLSQAREAEAMVEEREVFGKIVLVP